jgi:hypothetical protein
VSISARVRAGGEKGLFCRKSRVSLQQFFGHFGTSLGLEERAQPKLTRILSWSYEGDLPSGGRRQGLLLADAMLQLPDSQRREQKTFGARERANRWKISHTIIGRIALAGPAPARFAGADGARGLAQRKVTDVIHNS